MQLKEYLQQAQAQSQRSYNQGAKAQSTDNVDSNSLRSKFGPTEMKLITKLQNLNCKLDKGEGLSSLEESSSKMESNNNSRITVKITEHGHQIQKIQNTTSVVDIPFIPAKTTKTVTIRKHQCPHNKTPELRSITHVSNKSSLEESSHKHSRIERLQATMFKSDSKNKEQTLFIEPQNANRFGFA